MRFILSLTLALTLLVSCNKKEEKQADEDKILITNYVANNNLVGQFTDSGLWYNVTTIGGGIQAHNTATVKVKYTGYLLDGSQFDQSPTAGSTFSLTSVIQGWTEGIPKYKEGGDGKLIIPSALGYGNKAVGSIPANSVLVFDVELIEVL
jgi:FKBP-type peptidyl-prolyl cis-trans isomerase